MTAVFLKILNLGITAGWIVLAVLLLRLVFKKAPKYIHCLFWCIVGLRLILPFSIESPVSLIPTAEPIDEVVIGSAYFNTDVSISGDVATSQGQQISDVASRGMNISEVLSIVWIIGVASMLIYMTVSYILLCRRVNTSAKLEGALICDSIETPFILGFMKPRIYLPSPMNECHIKHVLAHEKAHIKRGDHLWKPIAFMILSVYWFNPLLWIGYVLLCRDIELACDEKVASSLEEAEIINYSETLLHFGITRIKIAACPLAFGEVSIKARVKNVLNYKKPAFWIIATSLVLGIAAAICLLTVKPAKDRISTLFHEHEFTSEITKEATCTEPGSKVYICQNCDYSEYKEIPTVRHDYEIKTSEYATCKEPGKRILTCINCGYEKEEPIESNDAHNFEYQTIIESTCTEKGVKQGICSECGFAGEKEETELNEHSYEKNVTIAPTCIAEGENKLTCTLCGYSTTESIPPEEHKWSEAACTTASTCSVCGSTNTAPLGHTTNNGKCERCGVYFGSAKISLKQNFPMKVALKHATTEILEPTFSYEQLADGKTKVTMQVKMNLIYHEDGENLFVYRFNFSSKLYDHKGNQVQTNHVNTGEFRTTADRQCVFILSPGEYTIEFSDFADHYRD